jgi:2-hydroxyacyl-CoA lyase 1
MPRPCKQRLAQRRRCDKMMDAFGDNSFMVEDPKDLRDALDEAMNYRVLALVSVRISQGFARKPLELRWHAEVHIG